MTTTVVQRRLKITVRIVGTAVGLIGIYCLLMSAFSVYALIDPKSKELSQFFGLPFVLATAVFGIASIYLGWRVWRNLAPSIISWLGGWIALVGLFTLMLPMHHLTEFLLSRFASGDIFKTTGEIVIFLLFVIGWPAISMDLAAACNERLFPGSRRKFFR